MLRLPSQLYKRGRLATLSALWWLLPKIAQYINQTHSATEGAASPRQQTHVPPHVAEVCRHRSPENQEVTARAAAHDCRAPQETPRPFALLSDESFASRSTCTHPLRAQGQGELGGEDQPTHKKFSPCVGELIRPLHPAAQPFAWSTRQPAGH